MYNFWERQRWERKERYTSLTNLEQIIKKDARTNRLRLNYICRLKLGNNLQFVNLYIFILTSNFRKYFYSSFKCADTKFEIIYSKILGIKLFSIFTSNVNSLLNIFYLYIYKNNCMQTFC